VLDGLEGTAAGTGAKFDRQAMQQTLAALGSRVFLLYSVHEDAPEIFETRWALSYLRGPLTRAQVKALMAPRKAQASPEPAPAPKVRSATPEAKAAGGRPALPPEVPQTFVPVRATAAGETALQYQPVLLGAAQVRFADPKAGIDVVREFVFSTPVRDAAVPVDWAEAVELALAANDLETEPRVEAQFAEPPAPAAKPKNYSVWSKEFLNWLYASRKLDVFRSPSLKETSRPEESEREFRIRLEQAAREERDLTKEKLRARYAPKMAGSGVPSKLWSARPSRPRRRRCKPRSLSERRCLARSWDGRG
jgi:hypothetical protein